MIVAINNVSNAGIGIWTSETDPQRLKDIAIPIRYGGRISIMMVSNPKFDGQKFSLLFNPNEAVLLNLGNTFKTFFISSYDGVSYEATLDTQLNIRKRPEGDARFFEELKGFGPKVQKIGKELLLAVRRNFAGRLIYQQISGKFVESPLPFWAILVQPKSELIRIVVYGKPEEHGPKHTIELEPNMDSYSSFFIDSKHQITEALKTIRDANRIRRIKQT